MDSMRRIPRMASLLLLILLGFLFFTFRLDYQSLWYDEGFSVYLAEMGLGEITARTASDIHPPLYYYLLHFWVLVFGSSEFSLRFPSVVFGLLTVPVIWAVGRRLLGESSGFLAAALVSISPLFLWYSQEARMYTLVTFLCLLSTYLVLRVMDGGGRTVEWTVYILASVVAVYTHFYAFFVLAFQFVFFIGWWFLWSKGGVRQRWATLARGLLSQAAVVAAYLPWSGFVLQRYGADVSYWKGTLRIGEVLRKTLITFSTGHSVLEIIAQPIAIGYLLLLLLAVAALALQARRRRSVEGGDQGSPVPLMDRWPWLTLSGLLLYLGLPCLLLLVVSYQRAKFHPRYLMLSSPAFLLLIAGGLVGLFALAGKGKGRRQIGAMVAGYLLLIYVGLTSGYALYNAYFDISFLKDDFRSAASFLAEQKGENEVVILTSGHMFPVFTYYYEGDDWFPIPDEPTLSAERVLDYSLADELNRILAGRDGVWALLWQHDVVDPVGFLTMMLGDQGQPVPYRGGFWGLKLLHYALPDDVHFSAQPNPDHAVTVNFGDQVRLLGYSLAERKATTSGLEVIVYWEPLRELGEDYKLSLRLRDHAGHEWGSYDGRPTGLLFPTFRWEAGQKLFGSASITPTLGTPPGVYQLQAGLYSDVDPVGLDVLDEQGTPQGTTATLGSVELERGRLPRVEAIEPARPLEDAPVEGLVVLGCGLSTESGQPGDTLRIKVYWHALSAPTEDYVLLLRLYDQQGGLTDQDIVGPEVVGSSMPVRPSMGAQAFLPANVRHPTSRWLEGEVVLGQYDYRIPIAAAPGQAQLKATLFLCREGLRPGSWPPSGRGSLGGEGIIAFQSPTAEAQFLVCRGEEAGREVLLAPLEVKVTERVFSPPDVQHRVEMGNLGDKASLYGYDLSAEVLRPGDTLHLTLYWQALETMTTPYTVFTHLLDGDNQVRGQMDSQPVAGARPTTGWVPQEYLRDEYQLAVQPDASPGDYLVEVGMYDASTAGFQRLPLVGDDGKVLGNRIILDTVIRVER